MMGTPVPLDDLPDELRAKPSNVVPLEDLPDALRKQQQAQMEHKVGPSSPYLPSPQAMAIALGRNADLAAAGLETAYPGTSSERKAEIARQQQENTRLYQQQKTAYPMEQVAGDIAWYGMGGSPAGTALLAGLQWKPTTKEQLMSAGEAYIGGKAGQVLGKMVGKAITPTSKQYINPAQKEALKEGVKAGYKAFPSMKTGSKAQDMIEAGAESNIFATQKVANIKMWNQTKLNREFAKAMGETADTVDEGVVARSLQRVRGIYAGIAKPVPAKFNTQTAQDGLNAAIAKSRGIVADFPKHELIQDVDKLFSQGATQEQLVAISTQLRQAAESQFRSATGDRGLAIALANVKNVVDDALMEGLSGAEQAALTQARKNWKYILLAMKQNIVNTANGDVSGRNLYNALKETEIQALSRGADPSPLVIGAKMDKAFPKAFGRSGTAERLASPSRMIGEYALNKGLYEPYFNPIGKVWAGNQMLGPWTRYGVESAFMGSGGVLGQSMIPPLLGGKE